MEKINKNIFFCRVENSEFYRKSFTESGFSTSINEKKRYYASYMYIVDDYIVELIIDKTKVPKVEIIDLKTDKEINQEIFFI